MAPAQNGGEGKEREAEGDNVLPGLAQSGGEGCGGPVRAGAMCAGGQDHEPCEGADEQRVDGGFCCAPAALGKRRRVRGGGMGKGAGAKACLIGKDAPADPVADGAPGGSAEKGPGRESPGEDLGQDLGQRPGMKKNANQRRSNVQKKHGGDQQGSDLPGSPRAAEEHRGGQKRQRGGADRGRQGKGALQDPADGGSLDDASHPDGADQAGKGGKAGKAGKSEAQGERIHTAALTA